jgi:small Trp-rich protein
MPLVIVGVLLLLAWWLDIGPFGKLPWWVPLLPFAGALIWWHFADTTGWTQRRAMRKMDERKQQRRERAVEALGLGTKRSQQATRSMQDKARRTVADPTRRDDPPDATAPTAKTTERREPKL